MSIVRRNASISGSVVFALESSYDILDTYYLDCLCLHEHSIFFHLLGYLYFYLF